MNKIYLSSDVLTKKTSLNHFLLIMRTAVILLFTCVFISVAETGHSQNAKVSLNKNNVNLKEVLNEIENQTDYLFIYNNQVNTDKTVSVNTDNTTVRKVLTHVLKDSDIDFSMEGNHIILSYIEKQLNEKNEENTETVQQQGKTITGTIVDEQGEPIIGANVIEKGTTNGTVTDYDGNFSLNVDENAILRISYIGYLEQEVATEGKTNFNITLTEDTKTLDEVVVVGYGTMKKANLTGAVDNITSESLSALKANTIGEALQGQIANVNVSIADGKPGRGAGFNVRGTTSINGGSPLIVIDGVPQAGGNLNNMSPQDIEEISVLKDAASAAIYGARAAYGVILVTTKKAKVGEFKVEYNNYFGYSQATHIPDVYDNPVEYLEIQENEFNKNIGQRYLTDAQLEYAKSVAADPSLPNYKLETIGGRPNLLLGGKVHNYYKEWFRKYTPKQNHHINIRGGTEKFQYYLSGEYNQEKGALKFSPEDVKRFTLRSNLKYNLNKYISIFNNTSILKRDEDLPNLFLYNFTSNIWRHIENSNPLMPEYIDIDGQTIPTDLGFYRDFVTDQSEIKQQHHDVLTTLGTDISLLNGDLNFHVDYSYQFGHTNKLRWWDNTGPYLSNSFNNRNTVLEFYSDAGPSTIYRSMWNTKRTNLNTYGSYDKTLKDNEFKLMVGFNQESYDYEYFYADHKDLISGIPQHSLNLATGNASVSDNDNRNTSRSVFSRFNYNYKQKYLLELNGSYYLTSKFEKENRGVGFASISGGWRVSEESFFTPIRNMVDNFMIRASYGSLGNQEIGSYDYLSMMNISQSSYQIEGNRVNYTGVPQPKSSNFTWETSKTLDIGIDLTMLSNRFNATFDLYQRETSNMLAPYRSLPSVFGASVPKENIATLLNKGWELSLSWQDKFSLMGSDFTYGARFNLYDSKAEITEYYNPTNYLGDYYVGQQIGEIWGLTTLGFFKTDEEAQSSPISITNSYRDYISAGDLKFADLDDNGVISRGANTLDDSGDFRIIGNTTPRYQYGLTLNAKWKGIDLNAFFKGVGKRDMYPGAESTNFWSSYNRKYQVLLTHVVENRWTPENPDAYFPVPKGYSALGNNDLGNPQTRYLQDASYVRLKNLTLGYSLPKHISNKIKMEHVRIYLSGQNLWESTDLHFSLDPEGLTKDPDGHAGNLGLGTSYPVQRVYSFGFEFHF